MATQFERSVWPHTRSWSPAEEAILVQKIEEEMGLEELSDFFRRSTRSIRRKAATLGYILQEEDPGRAGRKALLTDEQVEGLIQFYEKDPNLTLKEIANYCWQILGVEIDSGTVGNYFRSFRVDMRKGRRPGKKYRK